MCSATAFVCCYIELTLANRRVNEQTTHMSEMHKHIELLNSENRLLRDQLVYLYNVMRQNLSLSALPISYTPPSSSVPATPPPSPCSPYMANFAQPSFSGNANALASSPSQVIDLSTLGFKGYNLENEIFKQNFTAQNLANQNASPQITPALCNPTQNPSNQMMPNQNQMLTQNTPVQQTRPFLLGHNLFSQNSSTPLTPNQNLADQNMANQNMQNMTKQNTPASSPMQPSPTASPNPAFGSLPDLGTLKIDMESTLMLTRFSKTAESAQADAQAGFMKSEGGAASS